MLILGDAPNTVDNATWSGDADTGYFINWPAKVGAESVIVRVSARAFNLGVNTAEAKEVMEQNRALIQGLARKKIREGDKVITLESGDFSQQTITTP